MGEWVGWECLGHHMASSPLLFCETVGGGTSCFLYILFAFVLFKRLSDLLDFFPFVIKCNLRRTESIPFWLIIPISDTDE